MKLHPLSAVSRTVRYGLNGLGVGVFLVGVSSGTNLLPFEAAVAVGALLGVGSAGYGLLSYLRYEYALTADTFDVGSGVVGRTEREIPYRRIQNVDVTRNLFHRLFGVAVVRIETAGGGSTEAVLSVVSADEADRLQREIRSRRARTRGVGAETEREAADVDADGATAATGSDRVTATESAEAGGPATPVDDDQGFPSEHDPESEFDEPADPTVTDPLFAISPRELAALAFTRFRFGSLVFVVFGVPLLDDLAIRVLLAAAAPIGGPDALDPAALTPDSVVALGIAGVPMLVVAAYLVSAVVSVVEFYGFELGERGGDLLYERGLLRRYSGSIPTDKVQTLVVTETLPMRWLGFAALAVRTAGYAAGNEGNQSAIPLAERKRVHDLADRLLSYEEPTFERAPTVARRRYAVRYALVVAALTALAYAAAVAVDGFTLWYLPLALAPAVPVAAHLKWASRGYYLGPDHAVVRAGFWRRQTHIVPYYRLQTVTGEATVFQRRLGLASVVADTASSGTLAGRTPTAYDLERATARSLQRSLRDRLQTAVEEGP